MIQPEWTLRARGRRKQSDRWLQGIVVEAITFVVEAL
jgi:hypothetical protein